MLTLAACGRDAGAATEPAPPSTTAPAPSTSAVTSTTGAPTTTLSPEQQDDADLRALHDRFYRMIVLTANPPNPDHPEIAATTTGIQRQRSTEFAQQMKDSGERSVGEIRGRIIEIEHIDARSRFDPGLQFAKTERLAADGSVVGTDDGSSMVTELRVVRDAGRLARGGLAHRRSRTVRRLTCGARDRHCAGATPRSGQRRAGLRHRCHSGDASSGPGGWRSMRGRMRGRVGVGRASRSSGGRRTTRARTARCRPTTCWPGTSPTPTRATTTRPSPTRRLLRQRPVRPLGARPLPGQRRP